MASSIMMESPGPKWIGDKPQFRYAATMARTNQDEPNPLTMPLDEPSERAARDFGVGVARVAARQIGMLTGEITKGEPRMIQNPFTRQDMPQFTPTGKRPRDLIEQRGLANDGELLDAIAGVIRHAYQCGSLPFLDACKPGLPVRFQSEAGELHPDHVLSFYTLALLESAR